MRAKNKQSPRLRILPSRIAIFIIICCVGSGLNINQNLKSVKLNALTDRVANNNLLTNVALAQSGIHFDDEISFSLDGDESVKSIYSKKKPEHVKPKRVKSKLVTGGLFGLSFSNFRHKSSKHGEFGKSHTVNYARIKKDNLINKMHRKSKKASLFDLAVNIKKKKKIAKKLPKKVAQKPSKSDDSLDELGIDKGDGDMEDLTNTKSKVVK